MKPLLGNALTQPAQIDFRRRSSRLGNEASFPRSALSCGFLRTRRRSLEKRRFTNRLWTDISNSWMCAVTTWLNDLTKNTFLMIFFLFQPPPVITDKQLDEREHTVEEWKGKKDPPFLSFPLLFFPLSCHKSLTVYRVMHQADGACGTFNLCSAVCQSP